MSDSKFDCSAIPGAQQIISIYGYWPSFHDAAVISVLIEREGPTVTIQFRLNDMGPSGDNVMADATVRWSNVSDLSLQGIDEANWIWGMRFEMADGGLLTQLERMDGTSGTIRAESVEVVEAATIPPTMRW